MSKRPIYIVSCTVPSSPSQWGLWIPRLSTETSTEQPVGKIIHVAEDLIEGYQLEIIRNYNINWPTGGRSINFLGFTNERNIVDGPDSAGVVFDTKARDFIEIYAAGVAVPAPTLRPRASMSSQSSGSSDSDLEGLVRPQWVQSENCQTWVRKLVERLVHDDVLLAEALVNLSRVPQN